jgi:hypothetical protein
MVRAPGDGASIPEVGYRAVRPPLAVVGFRAVGLVHATGGSRRVAAAIALALAALLAALALSAATAPSASAACPTFRVLHNDRIGAANLPAGTYEVTPTADSRLTCGQTSALFTRFLQDWDGNLPATWRVVAQGSGRASFLRNNRTAFTVARIGGGGEGGGNNRIGRLCPNEFTVNTGMLVGPLYFDEGRYLMYLPTGSGITCRRASVLFTRFLGQPGGRLPFPWHVRNQTATFFKPERPVRSSFRVEPASGVS